MIANYYGSRLASSCRSAAPGGKVTNVPGRFPGTCTSVTVALDAGLHGGVRPAPTDRDRVAVIAGHRTGGDHRGRRRRSPRRTDAGVALGRRDRREAAVPPVDGRGGR